MDSAGPPAVSPPKLSRGLVVQYAVTFEFDTRPPLTHRGTVAASQEATCFARAVREAKRALRPINWSSVSAVLLERVPPAGEG